MRPDLHGLEITRVELIRLTGLDGKIDLECLVSNWELLLSIVTLALAGILIYPVIFIIYFSLISLINIVFPISTLLFIVLSTILFLIELIVIFSMSRHIRQRIECKYLRNILKEVIKYNDIVKLININDDLIDLGHEIEGVSNRKKVIIALRLTRDDLVRALKTERILRENKRLLVKNTDLLVNNLGTLTALQVSEQASEKARLLNETIQIAVGVQEEMRKLQNRR